MALKQKIDNIAEQAVDKYINNKVPLQVSVDSLSKSGGLESHKAKIVEATNKAAFLKLYPQGVYEFELAKSANAGGTPSNIISEDLKTGANTLMKAAGEQAGVEMGDMSDLEINHNLLNMYPDMMDANLQKTGSIKPVMIAQGKIKTALASVTQSITDAQNKLADKFGDLLQVTKQAMIRGTKFQDLETYALSSLPSKLQKSATQLMDHLYEAVQNSTVLNKEANERGCCSRSMICENNQYADTIKQIIKYSNAIPPLRDAKAVLNSKLDTVNETIKALR